MLENNDEIAKTFNKHFAETVEKLNTFEWPSNNEVLTEETLKNHTSIVKIKNKYLITEKFSFQPVSVKDVENVIKNVPCNKASGGDIPIQILKQSGFTYQILTDCINDAINKGVFPDSLKIANITPVHKKKTSRLTRKTTDHSVYCLHYQKSLKDHFMINLANT